MKRIEAAKNTIKKTSIVQEYVGMEMVDGEFAPITIPRLIPLKFNTVWVSDPSLMETILSYSYGTMLPREIEVPKTELRITTSPFTLDTEAAFISVGLGEHERSQGIDSSVKTFDPRPGSEFDGFQCSLITKILYIKVPEVQPISMTKLAAIEHVGAVAGAKNTVIFIPDTLLVGGALSELVKQGFKSEATDDDAYKNISVMTRKCKKPSDELADERVVFEETPDHSTFPIFTTKTHAVMIRDEDGIVHGGATVEINKPYAKIDLFFISDNVRGTGFGKKVMEKIEDYIQNMGIYEVHVCTHEFQAPWFYKKMGYEVIDIIPELIDGYDSYKFIKKLAVPAEVVELFPHDAEALLLEGVVFMGHGDDDPHDILA